MELSEQKKAKVTLGSVPLGFSPQGRATSFFRFACQKGFDRCNDRAMSLDYRKKLNLVELQEMISFRISMTRRAYRTKNHEKRMKIDQERPKRTERTEGKLEPRVRPPRARHPVSCVEFLRVFR